MSLDQAFRLTSILLAGVSFIALFLESHLPGWLTFLTGAALILALVRVMESDSDSSPEARTGHPTAVWNILVILGFFGFLVDSLMSGELLPAGIRFLLVLMVIKLFNLRCFRDYLHLHVISVVVMLAAASLGADFRYFFLFLVYLLVGVWTLLLLGITKQLKDPDPSAPPLASQQETRGLYGHVTPQVFRLANGLALFVFGVTLLLFFALPRFQAGFYQNGQGAAIRTAGFSDAVDLGSIGPIKRDPRVVMRVEPSGRALDGKGRLYLRGIAFDHYDGRSWVNQLSRRRVVRETGPGIFSLNGSQGERERPERPSLQLKIFLEPLDTPVLFGAPFMEAVSGNLPAVQVDVSGSFYLPFPSVTPVEYVAVSKPTAVLPADLQPSPVVYHEAFLRYFTQIPARSDRIAALARTVVGQERTPYGQAMAIQDHLSRNYRYSLEIPLTEQVNPLEEFLFNRKTGYCEHYATAMVIMLRTLGVPARLVTGFLATEWNEYGNHYVVRQQDAHAWVEVHLPHSGWIVMDPTPPSEDIGDMTGSWQGWASMMDHIRLLWNRVVVQFSAADQLAIVQGVRISGATVGQKVWDSTSRWFPPPTSWRERIVDLYDRSTTGILVTGFIAILVGLCLFLWLRWRQSRHGRLFPKSGIQRDRRVVAKLYTDMILYLSSKGVQKPVNTGPLQFLDTIRTQWTGAFPLAATITELYCRERFGRARLTSDEYAIAQNKLDRLMSLIREQDSEIEKTGAGNGI
ncbi:MAG: DUF3488 and transglutaminase-like domain-containing protein [Nitrospira sp.]|nr:DUF3488 and transglutaminase-like domain-containing protein [Nitrospira sp.]MCP9461064.1 DUF3488 and transglutaminase-like domain-containing protein [Nitrospira sp.]MCP9474029.1 DUF3488 and transglutaminase-like domain-containing protein [Nitrospira sp.]